MSILSSHQFFWIRRGNIFTFNSYSYF